MTNNHSQDYSWEALYDAVQNNDLDKICFLLSKRLATSQDLALATYCAARKGYVLAAKTLIKEGADLNHEFGEGTALTQATDEEQTEMVKFLIEAGADTSIPKYGEVSPPLMIAAEKGNLEMVELLIEAGADVNQIAMSTGDFALASAAAAGHVEVFNYLAPLTSSELRKEAEAILTIGIRTKELEENADSIVIELSNSVIDKNLLGIKEIIKKGVDVNHFDEVGNTALCSAAFGGNLEIVRVLLEAGADPNLTPEPEPDEDDSNPPLWFANSAEVTKLLIDAGADINFQNSSGDTILIMTARRWGALKKMKVLLENGADINIKNNEGKTALMYAAKNKDNLDKVKLLIENGADINTKDNDDNTALSLAREVGNTKIAKLLVEAGAKD